MPRVSWAVLPSLYTIIPLPLFINYNDYFHLTMCYFLFWYWSLSMDCWALAVDSYRFLCCLIFSNSFSRYKFRLGANCRTLLSPSLMDACTHTHTFTHAHTYMNYCIFMIVILKLHNLVTAYCFVFLKPMCEWFFLLYARHFACLVTFLASRMDKSRQCSRSTHL